MEMSPSRQRDGDDGMEQPKKADKIFVTFSQSCFIRGAVPKCMNICVPAVLSAVWTDV